MEAHENDSDTADRDVNPLTDLHMPTRLRDGALKRLMDVMRMRTKGKLNGKVLEEKLGEHWMDHARGTEDNSIELVSC